MTLVPIEWSMSSFEIALKVQAYLEKSSGEGQLLRDRRSAGDEFYRGVGLPARGGADTVGLICYDGAQRGELTDPPMTTIQQDRDRIAASAVRHVRKIASGNDETNILERIAPVVVMRASF